jgi:hypothetical protein
MKERDIIEVLRRENPEFQKLEEEHRSLEEKLQEFNSKYYLTPEEEMEIKKIKKQKLAKKDRMAELIRQYKRGNGGQSEK